MRIAIIGASEIGARTARLLIERGHEVVIVEQDQSWIDQLQDELDCSFLHGDGSKPNILREIGPEQTEILFCLTDEDQDNIIASLVGRSLGFSRVITSIRDTDYELICRELALEDVISPPRTISRYLADIAAGVDILELSTVIKDEARFFTYTVEERKQAVGVGKLDLPEGARVVCLYREGKFSLADSDTALHKGDEVVILTHSKHLSDLRKRFRPRNAEDEDPEE